MRKSAVLGSAITAVLIFALVAPAGASSKSSIRVSPDSLSIGDAATVTGRGFKPKSKFVLKVNDQKVASGVTTKRGRVSVTFVVPDGSLQLLEFKLKCAGKTASEKVVVTDGLSSPTSDGTGDDSGDVQGDDPGSLDPADQPPEFNF